MTTAPRRVPDVLATRAADRPDRVAHDDTTTRITYREWHESADALAGGLAVAGVAPGDRVLLPITNGHAVDFCVAYMGVLRAGAIVVPVNTRLADQEIAYFRDLVDARWGITDRPDKCRHLPLRQLWTVAALPSAPEKVPDQSGLDSEADADVLSTSGTTGRPKGVVFSHADLLDRIGDGRDWHRAGTMLHALPFTGFGGCHGLMLSTLHFGHTLVTQPTFEPRQFLELVVDRRPETLHLVPSMLRLILDLPDVADFDVSSVRWIITGTAPLPQDSVRQAAALWPHVRVINAYGMTESATGTTTRSKESSLKPGSVGRPDDPAAIQIRGEDGTVLPPGAVGEICTRVRRPRRYWNDATATEASWQDGWLRTGDLGFIDTDGDLILTGRAKELIIRGGYNISPAEIEDVLHRHPMVLEAAVLGVAHEVLGEDVAAAVVLRTADGVEPEALQQWCREHLAENKVPRVVVVVDALPYNQNAKVLKRELAPMLTEAAELARIGRQRTATAEQ